MPGRPLVRRAARTGARLVPPRLRGPLFRRGAPLLRLAGTEHGLASLVVVCEMVDLPRLSSTLASLAQDAHAFREVLLVPVRDAAPGVRAVVADRADPRIRVLPARPTWQDAANTGADGAAGKFLRFARACDVHPPDALADLVAAVATSGSDLATGGIAQRGRPAVWLERASQTLRASAGTARPVARTPAVAGDLGLANKLFRTAAWRETGCRLGPLDRWLLAPAVAGYLREARTVDVLDRPVVEHAGGHGLRAFGATPNRLRDLREWAAAAEEVDRLLQDTQLHRGWRGHVLDVALPGFLRDTERADDIQWADLRALVGRWKAGQDLDPALVRAESRTLLWLTDRGSRQEVERLCEELYLLGDDVPTAVAGDHLSAGWASLPADVPDHVRRLSEAETPLVVAVRRLGETTGPSRSVELFCRVVQADLPATACDLTVLDAAGSRRPAEVSEDAAATRWSGSALHRAIAVRADVPVDAGPLHLRLRLGDVQREAEVEVVEQHRRPTDPDPRVIVHDLVLDGTDLVVTISGPGRIRLLDDRDREVGSGDASGARIPLRDELFGRERWLPTGHYRLVTPRGPASVTDGLVARLPLEQVGPRHRLHATLGPSGGLLLHLGAPLADDEQGRYAQRRLVSTYQDDETPPDSGLVYFESYAGRTATDSPRAIHEELVARRPDLTTCWGVLDHAQEVPEGATPVLLRSREWYQLLARAGALVVNTDMEPWFRRRPGQVLMQTFHGYPSKGMGLGQWQAAELSPSRIAENRARGVDTWSVILTPAPEMTRHYREQYGFAGPAIEHGYPRNDALVSQDPSRRQQTRSLLGLRDDQTAVLYAPTWRENLAVRPRRAEMTELLDVAAAARALGDGHVILVRGHRFHRSAGASPGVVDVTEYPEVNDLLLAADVVVLDYSSLRFDAALTGSPMVFLVPDLEDYAGGTRSFLFPFADSAPGPFVEDTAGVVEQVRDVRALRDRWGPEIERFTGTYQKWQDGHSAERAVDALLRLMDQA